LLISLSLPEFSLRFILLFIWVKNSKEDIISKEPFRNKTERYGDNFCPVTLNDQNGLRTMESPGFHRHKPTLFIWGMKDKIIKSHPLDNIPVFFQLQLANVAAFHRKKNPVSTKRLIHLWNSRGKYCLLSPAPNRNHVNFDYLNSNIGYNKIIQANGSFVPGAIEQNTLT
jgi:hypothetical protein